MNNIALELKEKLEAMSDKEYIALWNSPNIKIFENVEPTIEKYLEYLEYLNNVG